MEPLWLKYNLHFNLSPCDTACLVFTAMASSGFLTSCLPQDPFLRIKLSIKIAYLHYQPTLCRIILQTCQEQEITRLITSDRIGCCVLLLTHHFQSGSVVAESCTHLHGNSVPSKRMLQVVVCCDRQGRHCN